MHQNHADFYGFFLFLKGIILNENCCILRLSFFSSSYCKLILMLSRGCISVVAGMDISFRKAHEILSDERNFININQLFLDWLEKLNHDTYLNTILKSMIFWPFNMFCGINFTSKKKQTRSIPTSVLSFFQSIMGLARWGQIAERSCWGNCWSCCAWQLPTKTESPDVPEKAVIHFCDKMGLQIKGISERTVWTATYTWRSCCWYENTIHAAHSWLWRVHHPNSSTANTCKIAL